MSQNTCWLFAKKAGVKSAKEFGMQFDGEVRET